MTGVLDACDRRVSVIQIYPHVTHHETRFSSRLSALSEFSFGTVVAPSEVHLQARLSDFDVHLVGRPLKKRIRDKIRLFLRCIKLARQQDRETGLDLVICYDPMISGLIGVIIKAFTGAKLIIEVNGAFGSPALYSGTGFAVRLKRKIYPRLQRFVLKRADATKLLFDKQLDHLDPEYLPRSYVYFDHSDIASREYVESRSKTLLSLGFPSYIKGLDLLVVAFDKLSAEFPDWKLVLYGFYGADEVLRLKELVCNSKNIEINKPVPFDDIPDVIDASEIFVLASRTEAMGRVLVEAMARSKPRIGSNVDGIPTVIADNIDGLLFESENISDLTAKLRRLMGDSELRERLARAGFDRFNREFTLQEYANYTKTMYYEVCHRDGAR